MEKITGKMTKESRWMTVIASLLLGLTFLFPLWKIQLWAPQYPEGLNLHIWSHKFTGDVQTINILNHYIGMAPIQPESFPELQYFPTVFASLLVLGLLTALIGRKLISQLWTLTVLTFASWGLYDFYKWGHKFGTNLSPDAAIKMDDMVYQPPLIGSKTILNITAASWPDWAGIAFTAAVFLAMGAVAFDQLQKSKQRI